jgi:hypothetical protein
MLFNKASSMLKSAGRGGSEGSSSMSMTSSDGTATETLLTASLRMSVFSCMLMTEVETISIALVRLAMILDINLAEAVFNIPD